MGDEYDSGVRDTPRMTEDDQSLHVLQEQVVVEQHEEGLAIQSDMVEESGRLEDQRRMTSDPSVDLLLEGEILGGNDTSILNDGELEEHNTEEGEYEYGSNEGAAADANNNGNIAASASDENDGYSALVLLGELLGSYYAQHSHGSMDESSDSYRESRRENGSINLDDDIDPPQPAKNHPYLPTAQPLFPEEWITTGKHMNRANKDDKHGFAEEDLDAKLTSLAIFEMDDIVLFPGATLPLRLRDRNWVNYLGALIDDARGLYGNHEGTVGQMGEVRIVILPHVTTGTRRTGRRRPREGRGRTGRWRVDLIRRGVTALRTRATRRTSERIDTDMGHHPSRTETDDTRVVPDAARANIDRENSHRQNQASEQSSEEESESSIFRPTIRPASGDDPLIGRIGTMATITFTHEETTSSANPNLSDAVPSRGTPHGHRSSSLVWQNRGEELVLTVLGTQRCRLIRPAKDEKHFQPQIPIYVIEVINDGSANLPPSWMLQPPGNARCSIAAPAKNLSLVYEEEGDRSGLVTSRRDVHRDGLNNAIRNLALRSSTPAIAYQALWPSRLCQKICDLIQEDMFEGLRDILPLAAGLCYKRNGDMLDTPANEKSAASSIQVFDPSAFSNWISSNVPLSQDDRLDLLEMTCTVQQLRYIIQKLEEKRQESILRCKYCGAEISQMRHVFSVGGSAGTTGAYVNEHGVVHQTVTLRKIDGNVFCVGRPETRESWFPGYSWQIAHCSICSEHLGWKFRRVGGKYDGDLPDRPSTFWGFSSITTDEHVRPRRVSFQTRRDIGV